MSEERLPRRPSQKTLAHYSPLASEVHADHPLVWVTKETSAIESAARRTNSVCELDAEPSDLDDKKDNTV